MSWRGSFVVEYMYCPECKAKVNRAMGRYVPVVQHEGHLLAGMLHSSAVPSQGDLMRDILDQLASAGLCHPLRVAFLPEEAGGYAVVAVDGDGWRALSAAGDCAGWVEP